MNTKLEKLVDVDSVEMEAAPQVERPNNLLTDLLDAGIAPHWPSDTTFVARVTDARHPTLMGRVKVICEDGPEQPERWVPTLHGQTIRVGDRVLMQKPAGSAEPIVIGVIDGYLPRPEASHRPGPRLELQRDEALQVCTPEGIPLIEVTQDDEGPIVRLLQKDTRLALPGKLSITAADIELRAANGEVRVEASDDVRVVGENIHLN
jgi:hypothetical protein